MLKTLEFNIKERNNYKGLADSSHHNGTELDYEDLENISTSEHVNVVPIHPKSSEYEMSSAITPFIEDKKRLTANKDECLQSRSRSNIRNKYGICNATNVNEVLDLQRMADKFSRVDTTKLEEHGQEGRQKEGSGFNFDIVTNVDKLLEEAYTILHSYQKKLDSATLLSLLKLILALNELPHLYGSTHREGGKATRVSDWLNNSASHPEPELCGFPQQGPLHIRKFVMPKMSSSDTNITFGKRKRDIEVHDKDDVTFGLKSSSDTLVSVHADWSRNGPVGKRRRVLSD